MALSHCLLTKYRVAVVPDISPSVRCTSKQVREKRTNQTAGPGQRRLAKPAEALHNWRRMRLRRCNAAGNPSPPNCDLHY